MRNVHIVNNTVTNVDKDQNSLPLTATTYDTSNGDIICAFGPTPDKAVIELRRCRNANTDTTSSHTSTYETITSWDSPVQLPDQDCDSILALHYAPATSSIYLALAGGDLVIVREKPQADQERIEIVGSIDIGIAAAKWSWQGTVLALLTREGAFILMSQQLEPLSETQTSVEDLKLSKHVSVGWGKKETQFQGKRAKALRDPTMPEFVEEGSRSRFDDGAATITWRGDGAYVAVSSLLNTHRRVIRVYSAEGVLDSVSEPQDELESALSWRPFGNVIAGIKRYFKDDNYVKTEVVFFERNGLRHGEFDLRINSADGHKSDIRLAWNSDSTILAVCFADRVQFWTMGNYHYYLKQEVCHQGRIHLNWHTSNPLRCCVSTDCQIQTLDFSFGIDKGSTVPPCDYGIVAVIDGHKLKLTPFKHIGVPPPMAYIELEAEDNIVACAASRNCQTVAFVTAKHLYLGTWRMREAGKHGELRHTDAISVQKIASLPKLASPMMFTQLVMVNDDSVYLLAARCGQAEGQEARLYKYTHQPELEHKQIPLEPVEVPPRTSSIYTDTRQVSLWVRDGQMLIPVEDSEQHQPLPVLAGEISVAAISTNLDDTSTQFCGISLDSAQQLSVDQKIQAKDVTSYATTASHLVYTTTSHFLYFVHLKGGSQDLHFHTGTDSSDERVRAVERGAKIVTVIPSIYAIILQMPRGNLETIYPRIMVLAGIREHVRNLNYKAAFTACHTHQVDLNILYDLNPKQFCTNIDKFVDQLKKPGRIDEFISKLKEEDVTKTLYQDTSVIGVTEYFPTHKDVSELSISTPANKVNSICAALITALSTRGPVYLQNIITARVCTRPPNLEAALILISDLHKRNEEEADIAVSHLCFLTDAHRLYDAALALYDLELTLLVAQNAQSDPKEYLPFLRELQAMSELRRRYTIDNHLRKYAKALVSLHAMNEHEELEAYCIRHALYTTAIQVYSAPPNPAPLRTKRITELYARYLETENKRIQAATLYESLQQHDKAYPLYALAHRWQESLTCASLIPLSPDALITLARQLADTAASENRDYRAAATITAEYLSDPITAASLLCKGCYFADALRLLSHPRHDPSLASSILKVIDPLLTEKTGEIIELTSDMKTQLASQVPRIEALRTKKAEDPLAFFGGDAETGDAGDVPDNISLAATDATTLAGRSMFTRYGGGGSGTSTRFGGTVRSDASRQTSKTRRKEERKRARGKKGSVYEEEYLVASVARLIARFNGVHEEVERLVSGLRRRAMGELAGKVEEVMSEIGGLCEDARRRVWTDEKKEAEALSGESRFRPSGAQGVLYDSLDMAEAGEANTDDNSKNAPGVKIWKGSGL